MYVLITGSVILAMAFVLPVAIAVLSAGFVVRKTMAGVHSVHSFFKAKHLPKENCLDKPNNRTTACNDSKECLINDRLPSLAV